MNSSRRPRIAVLGTGGTIAGTAVDGLKYLAGQLSVDQLLQVVPDAVEWVDISAEQIANVGSQSVDFEVWERLSRRIQSLADSGDVDGIVITHGTDTLEETAYFLHLTVKATLPIVLTGAMKPAHAPDADGPGNLRAALVVAASTQAQGCGVLVVMNNVVHGARNVQKTASEGIATFASSAFGALARVHGRQVHFQGVSLSTHTANSALAPLASGKPATVFVLFSHGDLDARVALALLDLKPDGIVLAGVGAGNTTDTTLRLLTDAVDHGVVVVRATRCGANVERNGEVNDDERRFVVAHDLNPQKSRILLTLALAYTHDPVELQTFFDRY